MDGCTLTEHLGGVEQSGQGAHVHHVGARRLNGAGLTRADGRGEAGGHGQAAQARDVSGWILGRWGVTHQAHARALRPQTSTPGEIGSAGAVSVLGTDRLPPTVGEGLVGRWGVSQHGRPTLKADLSPEFLGQDALDLIEDELEDLHLLQHGVGVVGVHTAQPQERRRQEITVGDLLLHGLELDRLHLPDVARHEDARGQVPASGVGDGLIEAPHQPKRS